MALLQLTDAKVTYKDWDMDVELPLTVGVDPETKTVEIDTPGGQGTVYIHKETICTLFQMVLNGEL